MNNRKLLKRISYVTAFFGISLLLYGILGRFVGVQTVSFGGYYQGNHAAGSVVMVSMVFMLISIALYLYATRD